MKKKISQPALMARINRKLKAEGKVLKRSRQDSKWPNTTGEYYCVSLVNNTIDSMHVDLVAWGRELGVLKDWEELAEMTQS